MSRVSDSGMAMNECVLIGIIDMIDRGRERMSEGKVVIRVEDY